MSYQMIEKAVFDHPTSVISIAAGSDGLFPSISGGFPKVPEKNLVRLLQLLFDDLDRPSIHEVLKDNYLLFSEHQAKKILEFAEWVKEDNSKLICQCQAGISRSAGVAAALSVIYNGTDKWVFDDPRYSPNMLVYRTILDTYNR